MKQNKQSEKQLFLKIWNEREHISELTGKQLLPINHFQWHWQFLHVLPKGSYPKYRFEEKNIILALPEEHEKQENFEKFIERKKELIQEYYKEFYNKNFD